jgi:ribosomal-protein-alanine N-acetyltransferase
LARAGNRSKIAVMALLDWIAPDHDLRLEGHGVRLRPHRASDYSEWASLRSGSRAFLQPWEPTWPSDDLSRTAYRRRLTAYAQDIEHGVAYPFLIFRDADGTMVGGITVSNVRRGVAQMASLGYWIGEPFVRRGHTTAAVGAVTRFCFQRLGLHREGLARAYLRINGVWRDHILFGLLTTAAASEQARTP